MLSGTLPPISRRSTYVEAIALDDALTGDPIDLTGAEITAELRCDCSHDDYGWFDRRADMTLTLASGITVPEAGIIVLRFEAGALSRFSPGRATLSILISRDGDTYEPIHVTLPIAG